MSARFHRNHIYYMNYATSPLYVSASSKLRLQTRFRVFELRRKTLPGWPRSVISSLLPRLWLPAQLVTLLFADAALATTPNYVQGDSAVPQTTQTTVTVTYTAAQTVGNLNVVIVGWNDSTAQVSSLTDSRGNVYQLAVGPTVLTGSGLSQAIYYAKNISAATAGANVVTVKFNAAAIYPDIRILEYSGINPVSPLDVSAGATGNSATSSSGAVITRNATDLLVGANMVWTRRRSAPAAD